MVPASRQDAANDLAADVDRGPAGHKTFTVPLHDADHNVAAYWCPWLVDDAQETELTGGLPDEAQVFQVFRGWTPEQVLEETGLHVPESEGG